MDFVPEFDGGIFPIPVAIVLNETMKVHKQPQDLYADALQVLKTLLP